MAGSTIGGLVFGVPEDAADLKLTVDAAVVRWARVRFYNDSWAKAFVRTKAGAVEIHLVARTETPGELVLRYRQRVNGIPCGPPPVAP